MGRFKKIYETIIIDEMFDSRIEYNPIYEYGDSINTFVTALQNFSVNNKNYKARADLFNAKGFPFIVHIEFVRVDKDNKERTDLTKDNMGYIGDIYGIILHWIFDVLKDPKFSKHNYILFVGEADEGEFESSKGNFYKKLVEKILKRGTNYELSQQLENYAVSKLNANSSKVVALIRKNNNV